MGLLLQRVVYYLFEWEVKSLGSRSGAGQDELRLQVQLEGAGGERMYISWAWDRGQDDYCLAHALESFFTTNPEVVERDVSNSPAWQPLIGRTVTVAYRDESRQVIEVRSGDAVVYCCSFQCDRVFIMQELRFPC